MSHHRYMSMLRPSTLAEIIADISEEIDNPDGVITEDTIRFLTAATAELQNVVGESEAKVMIARAIAER